MKDVEKRSLSCPSVGMSTSTAIMGNSVEVPQNLRNGTSAGSSNPPKSVCRRDTSVPCSRWNQPSSPHVENPGVQTSPNIPGVCKSTGLLFSVTKKETCHVWQRDELGGHSVKWQEATAWSHLYVKFRSRQRVAVARGGCAGDMLVPGCDVARGRRN